MANITSCKIFLHNSLWSALAMTFGYCMMSSTKGAKLKYGHTPYSFWAPQKNPGPHVISDIITSWTD